MDLDKLLMLNYVHVVHIVPSKRTEFIGIVELEFAGGDRVLAGEVVKERPGFVVNHCCRLVIKTGPRVSKEACDQAICEVKGVFSMVDEVLGFEQFSVEVVFARI